jgi:hypothetical protein
MTAYAVWCLSVSLVAAVGAQGAAPAESEAPAPTKAANIQAAERPLLAPAPGSPIATSGGALGAADVNNDGCADLVFCKGAALQVYLGDRERAWAQEPDRAVPLPGRASEIAVADFNRDGNQDLALADHDSYDVTVLLGGGTGGFVPAQGSPFAARTGEHPHTHGLVAADVDGDGNLDLATANNADGDLGLLVGDGRGGFVRASQSPFACGEKPYPIAAADLNGDGRADIVVPNTIPAAPQTAKTLHILRGAAQGLEPAPGSPVAVDTPAWYTATGDLNGDGRPDVGATHAEDTPSGVTLLVNDGRGNLSPAPGSPLALDHGAWGLVITDFNRDGRADLVIAADVAIQVFLGDGRGGFAPAAGSPYPTGKGAWRLVAADFNADGKLDVATYCVEAQRIEVLLGQ